MVMEKVVQQKIFLIINLSFFGDVLLTNALCQNIKLNYPDSKIVFVVNKPFYDAAKYQKDVDDVICFDKNSENKGIFGLLKFVRDFPYRNKIDTAFILYGNDRGMIMSYLLKCKNRISSSGSPLKHLLTVNTEEPVKFKHMQDRNASFITAFTGKKNKILPIKYITNPENDNLAMSLKKEFADKELIGLCTVGKKVKNNMPLDTAAELIESLNAQNKTVLYFGAGKDCREYANSLKKTGCVNFIDLTDITTIYQMANIMQLCSAVISIDTGTLHLAYSSGVPSVGIYYQPHLAQKWAPRKDLYPHTVVIDKDFSTANILQKLSEVTSLNHLKI